MYKTVYTELAAHPKYFQGWVVTVYDFPIMH